MKSDLFAQARRYISGGVNSPVRAFKGVGGEPLFIERAEGAYIYATSGRRYIDYVGSWGPMVAGHAHPDVVHAVQETAKKGLSFGAPTQLETHLAQRICEFMPSVQLVRMVNSGTEAAMSAIRLARAFTGREHIVKFEGGYHGHSDSLLVKAGSGALTLGVPTSPGVPAALAALTLTLPYNDSQALRAAFAEFGEQIAGVIVEPIAGNMSCVPPAAGFLQNLRELCTQHGSLLIFDEVMTGFRVARGGAQALYHIKPDLTTLGKIIGGGLPVGAFGGRRDIMEQLAPLGPVYQAGTLSGNPMAMAAGLSTLALLDAADFYPKLNASTRRLTEGLRSAADIAGVALTVNQVCGMFGLFFTSAAQVTNYSQVMACDTRRFQRFFHGMLAEGVYLAPSAFEAGFLSAAHTAADIDATIAAAHKVLPQLTDT